VYDTFNQSLIDKQLALYSPSNDVYEKPPKKRRYEVETPPIEQVHQLLTN
jgi:hypothetical protein